MTERGLQYRAFISYSHADSAWGRRIHRGLETYKLPAKLIGSITARGEVPTRLSPIFRDREELSAGVDLSAQVQAALAASDALIIICSPRSKASFWVGKEIETFRVLHPDRPIFAALIEGEPSDAFPDALVRDGERIAEPIAADFRKSGDGARLAKLKLVAGLTGLKLDDLVQRDAQRQWRRVMAVTLVAGVAVLIMALLLVMALRAQSEAERQRAEAEGLVEYMLTDLRDRLKGVGRLDVMAAVNERAMGYYTTQATLGDMLPESLERRARILHAMGEDDEKRGDLGLALKKFEEAHRTTAAVLAQRPDDADAIFAHAQSEYWVGHIGEIQGNYDHALTYYLQYQRAAQKLVMLDSKKPEFMMESGFAAANIGIVQQRGFKDDSASQKSMEAALRWFERAAILQPENSAALVEIANAHAWLADSFYGRKDFKSSLTERTIEHELNQRILANDAGNKAQQFRVANSEYALGRNYLAIGDLLAAIEWSNRAKLRFSRLLSVAQDNSAWLRQAAKTEASRADIFHKLNNRSQVMLALRDMEVIINTANRNGGDGVAALRKMAMRTKAKVGVPTQSKESK